jgi:hypothetical protein
MAADKRRSTPMTDFLIRVDLRSSAALIFSLELK